MSPETKQEGTVMVISRKNLPPEVEADRKLVRKLLGLRSDLQEFKIVYGSVAEKDDVVAVQTRVQNLLAHNLESRYFSLNPGGIP